MGAYHLFPFEAPTLKHFNDIFSEKCFCLFRPAEWDPNMYQSLRSYVGELLLLLLLLLVSYCCCCRWWVIVHHVRELYHSISSCSQIHQLSSNYCNTVTLVLKPN